jgi:hypothetical protein
MGKKSKRSLSRKIKHRHRRRTRNGGDRLEGAPLNYHLSGNWASRMSLGQGEDYFKYHEGQHGGDESNIQGSPFPGAIVHSTLPGDLRGPAHLQGLDKAFSDIAGLKDQAGGRRKRYKSRRGKSAKRRTRGGKSAKRRTRRMRRMRRRGGAELEYAPFPSQGMLLDSQRAYAQAGLNPEWKTDIAFTDAKIRDLQ